MATPLTSAEARRILFDAGIMPPGTPPPDDAAPPIPPPAALDEGMPRSVRASPAPGPDPFATPITLPQTQGVIDPTGHVQSGSSPEPAAASQTPAQPAAPPGADFAPAARGIPILTMPMGAMGTLPAHWQPGQMTYQSGPEIPKGAQELYARSADQARESVYYSTQAQLDQAIRRDQLENQYTKQEADALGKLKDSDFARHQEMYKAESRRDSAQRALENAPANANEFIAKGDAGQKIAAIAGLAIGGFLMGFQHRDTNPFLDQLSNAVQSSHNAKRSYADLMKENVADLNAKQKDDRLAELQTYQAGLDALKRQIGVDSASTQDMNARANGLKSLAQIDEHQADIQAKMADLSGTRTTATEHFIPAQRLGGMPSLPSLDRERFVPSIGQQGAYANTKEQAQQLNKELPGYDKLFSIGQSLQRLMDKPDSRFRGTTEYQQAHALQALLVPAIQESNSLSRMSDADIALDKEMSGDPAAWTPNQGVRMQQLMQQKRAEREYKLQGLQMVNRAYVKDPRTGMIVKEVGAPTGEEYGQGKVSPAQGGGAAPPTFSPIGAGQ